MRCDFPNAHSAACLPLTSGKNPAYDYFPCQFQLFYRGFAKGSMWYDPIFKVKTVDGREEWRQRHYRVRRAQRPGTFTFSVLDNGAISRCAAKVGRSAMHSRSFPPGTFLLNPCCL